MYTIYRHTYHHIQDINATIKSYEDTIIINENQQVKCFNISLVQQVTDLDYVFYLDHIMLDIFLGNENSSYTIQSVSEILPIKTDTSSIYAMIACLLLVYILILLSCLYFNLLFFFQNWNNHFPVNVLLLKVILLVIIY